MPVSLWDLVEGHLDRLLDMPEEERPAAIEALRRSGLDPRVLEGIEACLDSSFMPGPVAAVAPELVRDLAGQEDVAAGWIGRRLGPWRIVEPLGAGGWEASTGSSATTASSACRRR